jgi:hypothetical protein
VSFKERLTLLQNRRNAIRFQISVCCLHRSLSGDFLLTIWTHVEYISVIQALTVTSEKIFELCYKNIWHIVVIYNSVKLNIVAYRPVVKQWLCKHRPLLGNVCNIHASNNRRTAFSMWSAQRRGKYASIIIEVVISAGSVPSSYLEDNATGVSWGFTCGVLTAGNGSGIISVARIQIVKTEHPSV